MFTFRLLLVTVLGWACIDAAASAVLAQDRLSGPIRVVDADTFDLGPGPNLRLLGIDAPEAGQTCRDGARVLDCGALATAAAVARWAGAWADCLVHDVDRYGRPLVTCRAEGVDVNAELVRQGWALRYRDDPAYFEEEKEARLLARGVWAYDMQNPAAWRDDRRAQAAARNAPRQGSCGIKGNVSSDGRRLYHTPAMRSYGATRIDERHGERWFCTEREARRAGWRRAGS